MKINLKKWKRPAFADFRFSLSIGLLERWRFLPILLAITFVMYALAGIFYKTVTARSFKTATAEATAQNEVPANVLKRETLDAYKVIPERNLFGSTDRAVAEKTGEAKSVSQFDLCATVAGDSRYAFAVIEERGKKKQALYKVGDKIGGATLVKVIRNAVILKAGDREEKLEMKFPSQGPLSLRTPIAATRTPAIPSGSGGSMTISKGDVDTLLPDMGSMMNQALVRPHFSGGALDGYIVNGIQTGSIYQKMGIVNGDILQDVNSRKMQNADDMLEFYNTMRSGRDLSLKVKRAGKQETFHYVFQ